MKTKDLVGSGGKIWLLVAPFLAVGLALNILFPAAFSVGGPAPTAKWVAWLMLAPGVVIWFWSVALILTQARRGRLVTRGPYALMKHPIYTSVGLLVIPGIGIMLDSWLGILVGVVLYGGSRIYGPEEEAGLARTFGQAWNAYLASLKFPWL